MDNGWHSWPVRGMSIVMLFFDSRSDGVMELRRSRRVFSAIFPLSDIGWYTLHYLSSLNLLTYQTPSSNFGTSSSWLLRLKFDLLHALYATSRQHWAMHSSSSLRLFRARVSRFSHQPPLCLKKRCHLFHHDPWYIAISQLTRLLLPAVVKPDVTHCSLFLTSLRFFAFFFLTESPTHSSSLMISVKKRRKSHPQMSRSVFVSGFRASAKGVFCQRRSY